MQDKINTVSCLHLFILPLQERGSVYSKLDAPPLFPFRAFVLPLQELNGVNSNYNSPFLMCFPYHRSPSACLEGTHGDRVAGDNTQHSHRLLSSSFYVTRSRTKRIQTRPLTCTIRQARRSLARRRCGSCSVF